MAFDSSAISFVSVAADGSDLFIAWQSALPDGTWYQVYVNRLLVWFGTARCCHVPSPCGSISGVNWVDVGSVDDSETHQDFSKVITSQSKGGSPVVLNWSGGTYLDPTGNDDVLGFNVYASLVPGGPIDRTRVIASVAAYPGGWVSDGFGLGGYGQGGFGRSMSSYFWEIDGLPGGVWSFCVVPYDHSGTERGRGQDVSATVIAPPLAPACQDDGRRLTYEYKGPSSKCATLRWAASPSAS